ncbi:MAG: hypothetical protein JOZ99_12915 [Actinobacteria bacterium]|nr:hypothetical protein [Actinomycetota bacterium]
MTAHWLVRRAIQCLLLPAALLISLAALRAWPERAAEPMKVPGLALSRRCLVDTTQQ